MTKQMRIGSNPELDKTNALAILEILQRFAKPLRCDVVIGQLNMSPELASQTPLGLFTKSTGSSAQSYTGKLLILLASGDLLEEKDVAVQSRVPVISGQVTHSYAITEKGIAAMKDPKSFVLPVAKEQGPAVRKI